MAILTIEQFAELEDRVDKVYDIRTKNRPDFMARCYNIEDTDRMETRHLAMGSMAMAAPWGGVVEYDGYAKGYETDYRLGKYSTGIQFEDGIFRYKDFGEIKRRTIRAADAIYKTVQYYGASVFQNAFNDSYTSRGDSVGLCSAAHPYSPSDATTQNNEGTLDLSVPNLETTQNYMYDFRDDKGDILVGIMPNVIICGNYWLKTAKQIAGSKLEPFTADNQVNIYDGEITVIFMPMITGHKWFLADGAEMKANLNWYWGRRFVPEKDTDFDSEVIKFKLVGEYSYGWDGWEWIYGNNAA